MVEIFYRFYVGNFTLCLTVKEVSKSVKTLQSHCQNSTALFFFVILYICYKHFADTYTGEFFALTGTEFTENNQHDTNHIVALLSSYSVESMYSSTRHHIPHGVDAGNRNHQKLGDRSWTYAGDYSHILSVSQYGICKAPLYETSRNGIQ